MIKRLYQHLSLNLFTAAENLFTWNLASHISAFQKKKSEIDVQRLNNWNLVITTINSPRHGCHWLICWKKGVSFEREKTEAKNSFEKIDTKKLFWERKNWRSLGSLGSLCYDAELTFIDIQYIYPAAAHNINRDCRRALPQLKDWIVRS